MSILGYILLTPLILGYIEYNYHIAQDLIKRPRLPWYEYLSDTSNWKGEWLFYFVTLSPGLFIGSMLQDPSKLNK